MGGDDHERATCAVAGTLGHWMCGTCAAHNRPRFECGCLLRLEERQYDGLGRVTLRTARLALILEDRTVTVGPRDEATERWLEEGGRVYCGASIRELSAAWLNRGVSRRDLPILAAELQATID